MSNTPQQAMNEMLWRHENIRQIAKDHPEQLMTVADHEVAMRRHETLPSHNGSGGEETTDVRN